MSRPASTGYRSVRSSRLGRAACREVIRRARRRLRERGLARVLEEIAAHPRRLRFAFDPGLLARLRPADALVTACSPGRLGSSLAAAAAGGVGTSAAALARAAAELARVHAGELARLCRFAAVLRMTGSSARTSACEVPWAHRGAAPPLDPTELRAALAEELDWAARLAPGRSLRALLSIPAACLAEETGGWPSPTALAAASLLLAPHEAGRLCLGSALLVAGARADAARVFELALARHPTAARAAEMRRGLRMARGARREARA